MKKKPLMSDRAFENLTETLLLGEPITHKTKYFQLKFFHQMSKMEKLIIQERWRTPLDLALDLKLRLIYGEKYDFDVETQSRMDAMNMSELLNFIAKQKKKK
jgi:hypothetical protein